MTRAYRLGKVLVVANLQYTGIIFSSLWGMLLWGDVFDWHVWLGMGVILAPASPRRSTIRSSTARGAVVKDTDPDRQRTVRSTPCTHPDRTPPPWPPTRRPRLGDRRLPPRPGEPGRRARRLCRRPPAERAVRRHGARAVGRQAGADGAFRGRHPLPEKDAFIELLRSWGVNDDTRSWPTTPTAACSRRACGGCCAGSATKRWRCWTAACRPGKRPGCLCRPMRPAPRAERSRARAAGDDGGRRRCCTMWSSGGRTVVDARAPDRFRGENETIDPVGGHIPGAKNRFFKDNLQADGRFKAPAQLKAGTGPAGGRSAAPSCSAARA
jgi:hypothetical protein